MMEPGQSPTSSDLGDFSRNARGTIKRRQARAARPADTHPNADHETDAAAALEALREVNEDLRADIARHREAEQALHELNRDLELRVASRTTQLAAANLKNDQLLFSERMAREEAEVANRVKSDFLSLLSHEFRTPLQAIFGYTDLLEREIHGPLNEAQRRDLKRIQQSQQHLLGLITTILDFSRLESGIGLQGDVKPVLVDEILSNMEGFVSPQLATKPLGYSYNCNDRSLTVSADPVKLESIVLNLLANAIKFTPAGGDVVLECVGDREMVHIQVRDNGIGVPADKLEAIFQPFVQLRGHGMTRSGTGLGLAISRRLATSMGAELTAASNAQGSTFTLSMPAASSPSPNRESVRATGPHE